MIAFTAGGVGEKRESSGNPFVLVDNAAEEVATNNGADSLWLAARARRDEVKTAMWSCFVVVLDVLTHYACQMISGEDEQVIETILSRGPHPSLGERVRSGCQLQVMETVRPEPSG
jgi:hypothetical protein